MAFRNLMYRHWLEIRTRTRGAFVLGSLLSLVNLAAAGSGSPGSAMLVHIWLTGIAALYAGLVLGGTGIRSPLVDDRHSSLYFTLALPVPRFSWIWTRLLIGMVVTATLLGSILAAAIVGGFLFAVPGTAVRAGEITLLVGLLVVAVQAAGMAIGICGNKAGILAAVGLFTVILLAVGGELNDQPVSLLAPVVYLARNPPMVWTAMGVTVLAVGLALAAATVIARRKDF
jgi:hypothetical protein